MASKKMIIKGVGSFLAKRYNAALNGLEVITLGSLQSLKITLNVEIDDIFGGDGLFAIDTLVKSKSIEITATDAKFDLDAVRLMMGDSGVTTADDQYTWILNEKVTVAAGTNGTEDVGVITPLNAADLFTTPDFSVRQEDTNSLYALIALVADTEPTASKFMFDNVANKVYVPANMVGKDFILSYKIDAAADLDIYTIMKEEVPFNVHVIHHGVFLQKDNTRAGVETELYQCRARGTFTIDAARATASTSEVTLVVLDPERADQRLGTIKRFTL